MVNVPFRQVIGLNQQTYQRLSLSLHLNLRRQIFIAVCDDLVLRDRLAIQLQTELNKPTVFQPDSSLSSSPSSYPQLVSLQLSLDDPNPLMQIAQWLTHSPPPIGEDNQAAIPAFQILGIEHLTRQSPAMQRLFFTHLQTIEQNLPLLDFSILLWMNQPWFHALPDSVPEFWRCRTGIFEFIGDPTPLTITSPERFGAQSSQQILSSTSSFTHQTAASSETSWTTFTQDSPEAATPPHTSSVPVFDRPLVSELMLSEADTEAAVEEVSLPISPIADHTDNSSDDSSDNSWLGLIEDDLQEEPETDGLTQAEISTLLGDTLPVLTSVPTETEIDHVDIAATSLPTETTDVSENPWLALAESLTQLYEPSDAVDVFELQEQPEPQEQAELQEQEETASHPDRTVTNQAIQDTVPLAQEAEPERVVPFVPIQLPDGLAEHEQIQSILNKIEQLYQQQAAASVLVEAYRSLGNLFRDRIEQGEVTPQNLIVAIQAYEQALLRLPDGSPLWVDILNDLGNLYWMASRTTPNSAEALACLNQAIQAYQFALTKIDPQMQAYTYPMVQNNLGAAYADLARHDDPVQNLELSVQSYRQALHHRKPEADPLRYASTQNNLGTTYWNLAQYKDAATNLKLSIAAYADALQYYNPAEESLNYAMIQNNLGTAYWNLAQHERSQDWLMAAVAAYRMALKYRTLEANPVAHAATQNNLGTAYWHIANETDNGQERVDYLQQAIESYEAALHAVKHIQTHQPQAVTMLNFDTVATHNNLGLAYYQIATDAVSSLDTAKQSHYLQSALDYHVLAWQGWAQKSNLRQTAFNCIVQTVQATYSQLGMSGQSTALSRVPGELLPELLPKL